MEPMRRIPVEGLTVGSVYTGIGGWDLACTLTGWSVQWQCEKNPYRRQVLASRWHNVPCFPDSTDPAFQPSHVDLLVAACPEQQFASKGPLYEALWRAIGQATPTWVVIETTHNNNGGVPYALKRLSTLGYRRVVVPLMHGQPSGDTHVNWLRLALIGLKRGIKADVWSVLNDGLNVVTGSVTTEGEKVYLAYGDVNSTRPQEGRAEAARELTIAFGYPPLWLVDGPAEEMVKAAVDTTAVQPAAELMRLIAQPSWKGWG